MSGEIWQFILVGSIGIVIALIWLFVIYLPRWTAEGEDDNVTKTEDPEERD